MAISASWQHQSTSVALQRSSHNIGVVDGRYAYIFGGELQPRRPRDNQIFQIDLLAGDDGKVKELKIITPAAPPPRVGSASAILDGKMYIFSGRGGLEMTPIEELGAFWVFDTARSSWSFLTPSDPSKPFPQARSYHCATSDNECQIFIHAGCPTSGRLSDLWSFNVNSRTWKQHADAPAPPRGGSSITFLRDRVYRMNGFDGKKEQGGAVDVYNLESNTWDFRPFTADGISGPEPRSVGSLLPINANGRCMVVTLFGEGDPSDLGHAGAGKMFSDVWAYDIDGDQWAKVETKRDYDQAPAARGWFDAGNVNENTIFLCGGLAENNERLQDCWTLKF